MKLFGSTTSPYVRRVRLLLQNTNYEFETLNIFDATTRIRFKETSPLLKIPVLQDSGQVVFDSRQIFYYLVEKNLHRELTWDEENLLTIMDEFSQSLLTVLLARRSNISLLSEGPLGLTHLERISNTISYLETQLSRGCFDDWNFLSMSLYCYIDWIFFREIANLSTDSPLRTFMDTRSTIEIVKKTDPRLSPT